MTLPRALRDQYGIEKGQQITLLDLGGTFLLSLKVSRIAALCDQLRDDLLEAGATQEDMLANLWERREMDANGWSRPEAEHVSGQQWDHCRCHVSE